MTTTEVSTELVLTERHEGVLTIIINRPAQNNAINREVAVQLAAALDLVGFRPDSVGGRAHRRGRDIQCGHGSEGIRQRPNPDPSGSRIRRDHPSGHSQAADRGCRGMGTRWRLRDGAGLRRDRRGGGCQVRAARGEAWPHRRGGRRDPSCPSASRYHVALTALLTGEPISAVDAKQYGLVSELTASGSALQGRRACPSHRQQRAARPGEGQGSPARNARPQRHRRVQAPSRGRVQPAEDRGRT